jgi:hypothetical protein
MGFPVSPCSGEGTGRCRPLFRLPRLWLNVCQRTSHPAHACLTLSA